MFTLHSKTQTFRLLTRSRLFTLKKLIHPTNSRLNFTSTEKMNEIEED